MKIRQSLSMKLALVSVGLTLILSLIFSSVQILQDYENANSNYEENFTNVQNTTKLALARAVYTLDTDLANEIITGITANNYVKKITLYDELDDILASRKIQTIEDNSFAHRLASKIFEERRTYNIVLPSLVDPKLTQGRLLVVVDYHVIMKSFLERTLSRMINDILKSFGLLLMFILTFYKFVSRPLARMNDKLASISPKDPGSTLIPIQSINKSDEIGVTSKAINSFIQEVTKLQKSQILSEKALQDSHDTLSSLIDYLPHAIYIRSESGEFLFNNKSLNTMLATQDDLQIYLSALTNETKRNFFDVDETVFHNGKPYLIHDLEWLMPDGQFKYYEVRKELINFNSKRTIISVATDITERKRYAARIQHMAFHDSLTDLPNRDLLQDRLEQAIQMSERNGQLGALLFIDLDNFKNINDSLGHRAGDVLLKILAGRLSEQTRGSDTVARIGGDEFVIILLNLHSETKEANDLAVEKANQIRQRCFAPCVFEGNKMIVSASIGITLFPEMKFSASDLLRNADTAMYLAKSGGKDTQLVFEQSMAKSFNRQLQLEADLRQALEREEFFPMFQIQVDKFGQITGAEVLSRWQHPVEGLISPLEFIPVLESTRLITKLDEWVIKNCCATLAQWIEKGIWKKGMVLGINISPQQFKQIEFFNILKKAIEDNNIPPEIIDLEITENMIIEQVEETIERMKEIRNHGVTFSIDDFGTGYSSLSYLKRLPLDYLKVDQSFVREIITDKNDAAIVETILAMARHLGLKTIAEGVETKEQLNFLMSQGCNRYQGYYFSKPLIEKDFVKLLENYNPLMD